MRIDELPYIDEHAIDVPAPVHDVWSALVATVDRTLSAAPALTYARLVGCVPGAASGPRPLDTGSTVPGFEIARAVPPSELVMVGRHRFSSYALSFRIDDTDAGTTRLRAESRAAFPGVGGRLYRALVIGTRGHVVGVRRLLASVRRSANHRASSGP